MSFLFGGGGPSSAQKQQASDITGQLKDVASTEQAQGKRGVKAGQKELGSVADFWKPLLAGDRTAINEFLGPDIAKVSEQYDSARKSISELGPRGGGRNSALTNLDTQEASQIGNEYLNVRPQAAQALAGVGATQAGLGAQLLGGSGSSLAQALQGLLGQGQLGLQASGQAAAGAGQAGAALATILMALL